MPRTPRPGKYLLYCEIPDSIGNAIKFLAEKNSRKIVAEVVIALKSHLAASGVKVKEAAAVAPDASGTDSATEGTAMRPKGTEGKGRAKKR